MKTGFLGRKEILIVASFLLFSFAQPDISLIATSLASAFAFTLFWKGVIQYESKKSRFTLAFLWFSLGSYSHLSWLTANPYGGQFFFLLLLFFLFFLGLFFALFTLLIPSPERLTPLSILALSSLWTIGEWARLFFLSGYTWDPVGLMLTATLTGMQAVSLFGLYGLTFLLFFTQLWGLKALSFPKKPLFSFIWLGALLFPYLFGTLAIAYHKNQVKQQNPPTLSILLVQTALYPEEKIPFDRSVEPLALIDQYGRILTLLKDYEKEKIDLIAFSEAVLPYPIDMPLYTVDEMSELFKIHSLPMPALVDLKNGRVTHSTFAHALSDLFSADLVIGLEDSQGKEFYNAAFFFRPQSAERVRYEKRILLPMAEYIPCSFVKKFLSFYYGIVDSFTPGKEAKLFYGKVAIAPSICSEETYGSLLQEARQKGAKLFVNLTNDGWYPRSRLPMVHYLHGRLRAIEEGVPLVRACNTGVTSGINSWGECVNFLEYGGAKKECIASALHVNLSTYTYTTLYSKVGNGGIILSSFAFLILYIIKNLHSLRKKEK